MISSRSSSSSLSSGHLDNTKNRSLISLSFWQSEHTLGPGLSQDLLRQSHNSFKDISLASIITFFISSIFCAATKDVLASSVRFSRRQASPHARRISFVGVLFAKA